MSETFGVQDAVELAVVERGGFVESRHAGSAVVLSPAGEVVSALGDPEALVLPRSSLKPLQAVAVVTAGAPLEGERLAMATASHAGTDRHVGVVRDILSAAGLTDDALACPAAWPSDAATRDAMVSDHLGPSPVRHNCSGKHASMLAACVATGWDVHGYLDPSHPLQQHIREVVERLTGEKIAATVVDGCGAPVHALTLAGLARGVHRVGTSSERSPFALHRVAGALVRTVRENPWVIDGPGRSDTFAIERFGVFSKLGAEGVQVMVAPDGTTVALKTLDGSLRAAPLVALTLLARAGALVESDVADAASHALFSVQGGGREVGRIRATV
ncbi:asparaginase [Microbacterium marinilacus]|uniref:Asparaginase n=1 Tax=Microbacterium marinilacus TaxID=415209 RepID=A0ABP7B021_9MICO|nr:asparaginase [Microbacterium marinilacus]MBY0690090.1 asparaginase [Microbacterium marinilacus]